MYYEAFQQLNLTRPVTFGAAMPILLTEVECLCRLWQMPNAEHWPFFNILRQVDLGYLDLLDRGKKR